ncbi:copper chaperone PCu(A)C [Novosphingobium beihaiensis]|uniref:Copper chaperone PCu(A)C n=1 Tax=Novosphingobium beihaiensis TaxID=2930389 RepID=A0ABT0BMR3_9SPHN|nr:copper chaperone PCu(A)C [Novosphingobium beihaiensis]MCJ2186340.1 copper chaperone PCu(A)C [Novosphingobium beihaiensis]
MKPFRTFAFLCTAAAFATLAGCQQASAPAPEETAAVSSAASTGPNAKPGITASEGRLVLPVVAGRPAAVYFSIHNNGPDTATLAGVHVAGAAKAEMHKTEGGKMSPVETVEITPGATIQFAPGGYHVMAFDLSGGLKAGETTELTLTFSDRDKTPLPLHIEKMGGGMEGMAH